MFLKLAILFIMVIGMNIFGCAQNKSEEMTAADLKSSMKKDTSLIILDVRTPAELKGPLGQIDGVVNIPVQELEARIDELDKYKTKNIAVICRTGHRSGIAQEILAKHGIKSKNVRGGMTAYRELETK